MWINVIVYFCKYKNVARWYCYGLCLNNSSILYNSIIQVNLYNKENENND